MEQKENGSLYHIAIAVNNLKDAEKLYQDVIGLKITHREEIPEQGVRAIEPFVKEVVMRRGKNHAEGFILESKNKAVLNGNGSVVYIDVGRDEKIVPGNSFSIFQYTRNAYDPDRNEKIKIPGVKIGQLVVLRVEENTATGIVVKSSRQIEPGNIVVLDI